MQTLIKLLDSLDPFLRVAVAVMFLFSILTGNIEHMVASGIIGTWFRIETLQKQVKELKNG